MPDKAPEQKGPKEKLTRIAKVDEAAGDVEVTERRGEKIVAQRKLSLEEFREEEAKTSLDITPENVDKWTLLVAEKLKTLLGTEYSDDNLYAAFRLIKQDEFGGKNLFQSMKEKVVAEKSVKINLWGSVIEDIKTAAKERQNDRQLITGDWHGYLGSQVAKAIPRPADQVRSEAKPVIETASVEEKAPAVGRAIVTVTPIERESPAKKKELTPREVAGAEKGREVLLGLYAAMRSSLNQGEAVTSPMPAYIKCDIYLMRDRSGKMLLNGISEDEVSQLSIVDLVDRMNDVAKFSARDLEGYKVVDIAEVEKRFQATMDAAGKERFIQDERALEADYAEKGADESFFEMAQQIMRQHDKLPMHAFTAPLLVG